MGERLKTIDIKGIDVRTKAVCVDNNVLDDLTCRMMELTPQAPYGFSFDLIVDEEFTEEEKGRKDILPLLYEKDTPALLFEYNAANLYCRRLAIRRFEKLYKDEVVGDVRENWSGTSPSFWQRYAFPPFYVSERLAKDAMAKGQKPFVCVERDELTDLVVCPGVLDEALSLEVDMDEVGKLGEMFGLDNHTIRIFASEVVVSFSDLADPFFVDSDGGVNLLVDVEDTFGVDGYSTSNRKEYNYELRHQVIKALMLSRLYLDGWWKSQESWYRAKKEGMKAALSLAPDYEDFIRIVEADLKTKN